MRRSGSEPLSSLDDATRYLDGLINRERASDYVYSRLDLRPAESLVAALGRPHDRLSVVHVAGSKGKGSTCLFSEAILAALGERVGTFTSPHLEHWRERFRIGGEEVAPERLVAAVERMRPVVDALREGPIETRPSFFDATTALAFLLFAEAGVDRAVVEVGLGGRLDSTNVVAPAVTCITSIELEHTDKLGKTEAAIAGEKAGIVKRGVPLVVGALRDEAMRVVRARAESLAVPIWQRGEDFDVHSLGAVVEQIGSGQAVPTGQRVRVELRDWTPFELTLSAPGEAAAANAVLAIACVRALGVYDEAAIRQAAVAGLARAALPGRIEILANDPAVLIDAAHTERSAQVLARALESLAPAGYALLVSISSDKNVDAVLAALLPRASRVWLTRSEPQRSLDPDELAKRVRLHRPEIPVDVVEDPMLASRAARAGLAPGQRLCAVGSVYLAGITRRVLGANPGPEREAPELAPRTFVRREG